MGRTMGGVAGKAILVTGANRGIGRAFVEEALRRGAGRVYAGTRDRLWPSDERVVPVVLEVTNAAQIQEAVAKAESLDVLINNAGIALYDDLSDRTMLERHLAVNLFGTYAVTQAFLPKLIRSRGAVVNNLSVNALAPLPLIPAYSISKAAAFNLTQSLRAFLAPQGVRVHAVLTGPVDTDLTRGLDIPKATPRSVAAAVFDALDRDEQDIFPDPMSQSLAQDWESSPAKALERQYAELLAAAPAGARLTIKENKMNDLSGTSTIVVGASRGLGRGIATVAAEAGASVIAVARSATTFPEPATGGGSIQAVVADAADASAPGSLLDKYDPRFLVLVAGAIPPIRPLHEHTWETFSANWNADVRIAFHWLREALLKPLRPGSRVVVISSGAALAGSPLSGGYAGAKATQRFITGYAQDEANRADLGITFTALLPKITPLTELGRPAVQAYAARGGQSEEEYLKQLGEPVSPEGAGAAVVELLRADADTVAPSYLLTGTGLQKLA